MKKKAEWSKLWMALIVLYGIGCGVAYYVAVFMNKLADPTLAVQAVITILGGFVGYLTYQFGLKNSRNKYGVDHEGNPYKQNVGDLYGHDADNFDN
jgi:hypothetical protein